jgi:putative oxidoreductase
MMSMAYTLGRILLSIVFVVAGVQKLWDVSGIAKMLADNKLPVPDQITPYLGGMPKFEAAGYLIGAVELICGLMIMVGLKARWGALGLLVFTAGTIVFVHHFWDMQGAAAAANQAQALKNLSIMGGLLLVVAGGSGGRAFGRG